MTVEWLQGDEGTIPLNDRTKDQVACIMALYGSVAQQREAAEWLVRRFGWKVVRPDDEG